MANFYWDDLLDDLTRHRKVVPVIGLELLDVPQPGGPVPFYRALALRAAEKLRENGVNDLPTNSVFPEFVAAALRRVRHRGEFTRALSAAHRELLSSLTVAELPEPLRQLAEITDIPLVLTTGIDGLAGRALRVPDDTLLVSTLSENIDLPADWQPPPRGSPPTLVHLFGRIAATPGFALTEEDTLEFMWGLQGEKRPPRLLSRIRRSHILLIGNRFPDWLARFFLRLLRGERLSVESENFTALADSEALGPRPLVAFLQHYSPQTRVYTEGSVADFVRELHDRWRALQPEPDTKSAGPLETPDPSEPMDMRAGAIFISYASEDRLAAAALAEALDRAGLDVWLDIGELRGGDRYKAKIRRHIQQCDLFVPLMSHNTESRQDAFFRFEWDEARKRLQYIGPARPFMMPVVIDDLDAYRSQDLTHYFEAPGREVHVVRVSGGKPDEHTVQDFIRAVRQVRAPKRVADVAIP